MYSSSITKSEIEELVDKINDYTYLIFSLQNQADGIYKLNSIVKECEKKLSVYDRENKEFVIESLFYSNPESDLSEDITEVSEKIMSRYGTEPKQVINAFEDCFQILERHGLSINEED